MFFLAFYIVMPLIFLNLFVAILLDGYESVNSAMKNLLPEEELDKFEACWAKLDPLVRLN